jgi:hypothetical protein
MTEEMYVQLESTARHNYKGRWLYNGNFFEATPRDAEDLITLKFAKLRAQPVPPPQPPQPPQPAKEAPPPEEEVEVPVDEPEAFATRELDAEEPIGYQTRDMAPEPFRSPYQTRDMPSRRPRGRPRKTGRY